MNVNQDRWNGAAYAAPSAGQQRANRVMGALAGRGLGFSGLRELEVVGRKSGKAHRIAVNLLVLQGEYLLVSVRGQTQWARNVRDAKTVSIRRMRRAQYQAVEIADDGSKVEILRAYLDRWQWQVSSFLPYPVTAQSSTEELASAATRMPMFRLRRVG